MDGIQYGIHAASNSYNITLEDTHSRFSRDWQLPSDEGNGNSLWPAARHCVLSNATNRLLLVKRNQAEKR